MTSMEYRLLCAVRDGACPAMDRLTAADVGVLADLQRRGLVTVFMSGRAVICPAGLTALAAHEEELHRLRDEAERIAQQETQQKASEKRSARRSWWQFWLGLFLGWILGSITAADVVAWVMSLFH